MSRLPSEQTPYFSGPPQEQEQWRAAPAEREGGTSGTTLLLTGLVVLGLGYLAWQYIGPDLRRYMKIRSM